MSAIELREVCKCFGETPVLSGVNLLVPAGKLTAVLGASGSGKTTLLRLIAGFEQLDSGRISIAGQLLDDGRRSVRPQHRGIGYVPQEGALFPHLSAHGNVSFALPRSERTRAAELLELVGLAGLERRYPHQLSGGQQQRVALARALAIRPRAVLLDEPFASLDASLRVELGRDVAAILATQGTTAILVTHDQNEALSLAGQIALLDRGHVLASDDPHSLYHRPADSTVATALGVANLLAATMHGEHADCALGRVAIERANGGGNGRARLLLRPEQLRLHTQPVAPAVTATVNDLRYHGHDALARIRLDGGAHEQLLVRVPGEMPFSVGQQVWVEPVGRARAWPEQSASAAGGDG